MYIERYAIAMQD
jgi:hypothetical protein